MRKAFVFVVCLCAVILATEAHAAVLTFVSDLISTSKPSADATHTVQFTATQSIPPSGTITITPQSGKFFIPSGFNFTDVDLAVATTSGAAYVDRDVATTSDALNDGVTVTTGSSGSIEIQLNSTTGISAGELVQVRLGTNATVGVAGIDNFANPAATTSYIVDVQTKDQFGSAMDFGRTMIAVIDPVTLTATGPNNAPQRFNGLPDGLIAAGNTQIELSLQTNIPATCRYATSTGVLYGSMTAEFNSASLQTIFFLNTSGYQNNTTYSYYVRCRSLSGVVNTDDFVISFTLKPTPSTNTSIESDGFTTSGPTGNLGRGGSGEFPNGSDVLFLSSVKFSGSTIPGSTVTILKDGVKTQSFSASGVGSFESTVSGLERGAYGFQLYTQDGGGLLSSLYGTSLSVAQGTNNEVTNIILPPTIKLSKEAVGAGESTIASGGASPNTRIEVRVVSLTGSTKLTTAQTYFATSSASGAWSADIDTSTYAKGQYAIQARVVKNEQSKSGFSKQVNLLVGNATAGSCGKPDMNGDGKVNLVDFSIFLLSWQTTDAKADFNCDHIVNLGDFSIMLFNWTG